jgi:hypothetical protein
MAALYFKTCLFMDTHGALYNRYASTHASKQLSRTGNVVRRRKYAGSLRVLTIERGG